MSFIDVPNPGLVRAPEITYEWRITYVDSLGEKQWIVYQVEDLARTMLQMFSRQEAQLERRAIVATPWERVL